MGVHRNDDEKKFEKVKKMKIKIKKICNYTISMGVNRNDDKKT